MERLVGALKRFKAGIDDDDAHVELPKEDAEPPRQDGNVMDADRQSSIFPPQSMAALHGLLFLGALEETFEYGGHSFHIRTLTEGETMRVGQLIRDYRGTASEPEALRCFTVAACTVDVDGYAVAEPYKDGYDQVFEAAKVVRRWYPSVVRAVYGRYCRLEGTASEVADSLKKS